MKQYSSPPAAARNPRTARSRAALALLGAVLFGGCAGTAELRPAKNADRFRDDTAFARSAGVLVRAEGDWRGAIDVRGHVTPVHLTLVNDSPHTLQVDYGSISLVGEAQVFAALPPNAIRGTVWQRDLAGDTALFPFLGAPRAWPDFNGMGMQSGQDAHRPVPLPTPYMLDVALSPGPLPSGGVASGYVYFERVPRSAHRVVLSVQLLTSDGRRVGDVHVPFVVD